MTSSSIPQPSLFCKEEQPPQGAVWLAFTRDHNRFDAAQTFQRRYDLQPDFVLDAVGGLLLVGPVPEVRHA